ncbi:MAG: hypothetical protein KGD73_10380, partial [Candidatus Lokiarchaeota archaeon]|nr:hypothetical protein [Candidatus Lokiarchaeota archaeon]
ENTEIDSVEEYIDNLEYDIEEEDYIEANDDYDELDYEEEIIDETEVESYNDLQKNQAFETPTESKMIHIGGFFGKMYKVRKDGGNLVYERISELKRSSISNTSSSSEESIDPEDSSKPKIWDPEKSSPFLICPNCGKNLDGNVQNEYCPYCGQFRKIYENRIYNYAI